MHDIFAIILIRTVACGRAQEATKKWGGTLADGVDAGLLDRAFLGDGMGVGYLADTMHAKPGSMATGKKPAVLKGGKPAALKGGSKSFATSLSKVASRISGSFSPWRQRWKHALRATVDKVELPNLHMQIIGEPDAKAWSRENLDYVGSLSPYAGISADVVTPENAASISVAGLTPRKEADIVDQARVVEKLQEETERRESQKDVDIDSIERDIDMDIMSSHRIKASPKHIGPKPASTDKVGPPPLDIDRLVSDIDRDIMNSARRKTLRKSSAPAPTTAPSEQRARIPLLDQLPLSRASHRYSNTGMNSLGRKASLQPLFYSASDIDPTHVQAVWEDLLPAALRWK